MSSLQRTVASEAGSFISALLGLAFVASCVLMVMHASKDGKLELTVIAELMLVAVLSLEGIVAVQHLRQSRLDGLQALFDVRREYQGAEMTLAIATLWKFHKAHGARFVEVYLETWQRDEEYIAGLPAAEQVDGMRGTLHYRRRMVKEFYNLLAGLYEHRVLSNDVVYTYWVAAELQIIPEILIPLESAVAQHLRGEKDPGPWLQRMQRLYDDCPEIGAVLAAGK
jgi:hypothetical protein